MRERERDSALFLFFWGGVLRAGQLSQSMAPFTRWCVRVPRDDEARPTGRKYLSQGHVTNQW